MIKIQTTSNLPKYQINSTEEKEAINFRYMTIDFNNNPNFLEFDNFDSLANLVESGQHFTGCTFNGNKCDANVDSISLFILDIDNTLSLEEMNKRLELLFIEPNLMYYSISNIEKGLRYRVVFKLISPVIGEEIEKYKNTIEIFTLMVFPEADPKSFSISQFWLGTKKDSVFKKDNISFFDIFIIESKVISYYTSLYNKNYSRKIVEILNKLYTDDKKNFIKKIENSFLKGVYEKFKGDLLDTKDALKNSQIGTTSSKNPNKNDIFIKNNIKYDEQKNNILKCKLTAEFINSERKLTHTELYHLANNFYFISNGEANFINILETSGLYDNKKINEMKAHFKYLRKIKIDGPTYCHFKRGKEINCPHFEQCPKNINVKPENHNILHILKNTEQYKKVKNVEKTKTIKKTIEDIRPELIETLNNIYFNYDNGIYVVCSPCGSGKSFWNKITDLDDTVVSVKTLAILDEYRESFSSVRRLPELDQIFLTPIKKLSEQNLTGKINILKKAKETYYKKGNYDKVKEIDDYIFEFFNVYKGSKVATTHANYFNHISEYKQSTIIIDEDPIDSILKIKSIKLSDITKIINKIEDNEVLNEKYTKVKLILKSIKNKKENKISKYNILEYIDEKLWDECFYELSGLYDTPVISLKNHKYFVKTDNGTILFCENKVELPKDKKIIIQSATIDESMARLLYGEDIKYIKITDPELKGKLIQDPDFSYSRVSLKKQLENFKVKEKIERIKLLNNIDYIISFLGNKDEFIEDNISFLNFGATTGINTYTGMNGIIAGNPYPNPERVKLIAAAITNKVTKNTKMKFDNILRGNTMSKVNLFEDEVLKTIQINCIETEIIQSIGRSRLFTEDCIVYLLASFPVDGSIVESL